MNNGYAPYGAVGGGGGGGAGNAEQEDGQQQQQQQQQVNASGSNANLAAFLAASNINLENFQMPSFSGSGTSIAERRRLAAAGNVGGNGMESAAGPTRTHGGDGQQHMRQNSMGSASASTSARQQSYKPYNRLPEQREEASGAINYSNNLGINGASTAMEGSFPSTSYATNSGGAVKASSTTAEFTKRKNWSQHIIDEIQDFMHVLSPGGDVMFCTPSVHDLTGWEIDEVVGKRIFDFIHPDDVDAFSREYEASISEQKELTLYYRFRMKDERYLIFEVTGHPYYVEEGGTKRCKCFFAMGRQYPSKNTAMLDSFLELKIENERLRQELQVMYRDIEGTGMDSSLLLKSSDRRTESGSPTSGIIDQATGLVKGHGLIPSSSNTYGALGIGISSGPKDSDKKKKKAKAQEGEFVCRDCGTVDSPEWRKGPDGPKSLCNACGLRWAKRVKPPPPGSGSGPSVKTEPQS